MQFLIVRSASDIPDGRGVLGIEVPGNRPDLIERCTLGNIDPQHGGSEATGRCAVLEAFRRLSGKKLPDDIVFVTPRFDLDAAAAMAILASSGDARQRLEHLSFCWDRGTVSGPEWQRLRLIDAADSFTCGAWPGLRPLPTVENPWFGHGGVSDLESLAAPNWVTGWASQGRITPAQAVRVIGYWLLYGDYAVEGHWPMGPQGHAPADLLTAEDGGPASVLYMARHEALAARVKMIDEARVAIEAGTLRPDGGLVYIDAVDGPLIGAALAYCLAPVSVIRQRDPRNGHLRYTIASFDAGRFDQSALAAELTRRELDARIAFSRSHLAAQLQIPEGDVFDGDLQADVVSRWGASAASAWGGPGRMVGSPQTSDSLLTPVQVLGAVARHMPDPAPCSY